MLKTALIGCGAIAHEHYRYLQQSPLTKVVAVCDRSPAAGRYFRERFGVPTSFTDASEMLDTVKPDVVHVLTPPSTHADLVVSSLAAGAHVFCEKPIALSLAALAQIEEAARRADRYYAENHNYRFNDPIRRLDALITANRLGAVRQVDLLLAVPMADSDLGSPAGAVHDYLTHAAYLALHFMDAKAPAEVVGADWALIDGPAGARYSEMSALVRCGDTRASIRISGSIRPMAFRVAVRGTKGMAEAELFQPYVRQEFQHDSGQFGPLLDLGGNGLRQVRSAAGNLRDKIRQHGAYVGLVNLLGQFYEAIQAGRTPPVSATQIRRSAQLIEDLIAKVPA